MARVRSKNQCSCCKKSSSSEPPSSSTDPSYDPPSSSKDPSSSDDPSSDDPSSSSQKTSYDTGKCCAIPTDYIVDSEVFPSNEFDEAEEWIKSQRSGRENVGFLFHGPIRLRFDGGWFVAVICVGKLQDDGSCECNEYGDPESYTCEETDDPGYCYYLSGIPGLGVFTEGGDCDCGGSESGDGEQANGSQGGCDKCSESFEPCEIGCSETGCGCCYEEPPPPGADGVACSKRFMIVDYDTIQTDYPEILQDKNCPGGSFTAEENTVLGDLIAHLVEEQNIEADSIKVASFRGGDGCRVEIWGKCSCASLANDGLATCQGGPVPTVWAEAGGATGNDPDFPGISNSCTCEETCPPDKCYDAEALDVDVFDQWQAEQIGVEWKDPSVDGECPEACLPKGICCYEVSNEQDGEYHFDSIADAVAFAEGQELGYYVFYPGSGSGAEGPNDVIVETFLFDGVITECDQRPETKCPEGLVVETFDDPVQSNGIYQDATVRGIKWFDPEEYPDLTCDDNPCAPCPCPREDLVSGQIAVDIPQGVIIFRGCTGCENAPEPGTVVPIPGGEINDQIESWVGGDYFAYCSVPFQDVGGGVRLYNFTVSDPPPCGQKIRKDNMPKPTTTTTTTKEENKRRCWYGVDEAPQVLRYRGD